MGLAFAERCPRGHTGRRHRGGCRAAPTSASPEPRASSWSSATAGPRSPRECPSAQGPPPGRRCGRRDQPRGARPAQELVSRARDALDCLAHSTDPDVCRAPEAACDGVGARHPVPGRLFNYHDQAARLLFRREPPDGDVTVVIGSGGSPTRSCSPRAQWSATAPARVRASRGGVAGRLRTCGGTEAPPRASWPVSTSPPWTCSLPCDAEDRDPAARGRLGATTWRRDQRGERGADVALRTRSPAVGHPSGRVPDRTEVVDPLRRRERRAHRGRSNWARRSAPGILSSRGSSNSSCARCTRPTDARGGWRVTCRWSTSRCGAG